MFMSKSKVCKSDGFDFGWQKKSEGPNIHPTKGNV